jgi:hypothetical protein
VTRRASIARGAGPLCCTGYNDRTPEQARDVPEKKPANWAGEVSGRKRSDKERPGSFLDSSTAAKIV